MNQDILLKCWRKLPEFDFEPNKGRFRTWLYQVVRNHVYDYLSSKKNRNDQKNLPLETWNVPATQGEIDSIMDKEWKAYITSLAMKRIEKNFSSQNLEIFKRLLKGEELNTLAKEFQMKANSLYKVKNKI